MLDKLMDEELPEEERVEERFGLSGMIEDLSDRSYVNGFRAQTHRSLAFLQILKVAVKTPTTDPKRQLEVIEESLDKMIEIYEQFIQQTEEG